MKKVYLYREEVEALLDLVDEHIEILSNVNVDDIQSYIVTEEDREVKTMLFRNVVNKLRN